MFVGFLWRIHVFRRMMDDVSLLWHRYHKRQHGSMVLKKATSLLQCTLESVHENA